jgi:hypothetical protein
MEGVNSTMIYCKNFYKCCMYPHTIIIIINHNGILLHISLDQILDLPIERKLCFVCIFLNHSDFIFKMRISTTQRSAQDWKCQLK